MPNDLQYNAPTDANGNPFVGGVDPATGHLHPFEGGTTTAITGSPTSATAIRLVTETKDGGDAALGATTDAAVTSDANGTLSGKLRGLVKILADVWDSVNHRVKVDGSGVTQPVSGTVGVSSLPAIPAGSNAIGSVSVSNFPGTQPVSGTVTANAGTNLNTSALALETGGNLATAATNTTGLNNTVGTAAAAIPSKLVQIGGSDGTNARAVKTNSSGQLDVRPLTSSDQVTTVPSGTQTVSGTVTANIGTSGSLALETGGNLATLAGIVSSSKAAVKAASGDLADGALATLGAKADAKSTATDVTAVSAMSVLKEISFMEQNPASRAVTNAGTFAVQATLQAGSAIAGKVGIDQTTPGTTNAVAATNLPTTVDTNSGTRSASTLRVVLATDQPQLTNKLLVTPDANSAVNVAQWNGAAPSSTNPVITQDQIRALVANGQGFRATTGTVVTGGANAFVGLQLTANNVGKTIAIYNIYTTTNGNAVDQRIYQQTSTTADSNLTTDISGSITNQQPGSGTATVVSTLKCSPANVTATSGFQGTQVIGMGAAANGTLNFLQNGSLIYLKNGTTVGASCYVKVPTSGNLATITFEWVEF